MITIENQDLRENRNYVKFLKIFSNLSNLFSESDIPFLHYRIAENLFCKCYNAENLSRSDSAFDAKIGHLGIGIKTFIMKKDNSREKIAEFNKLYPTLKNLDATLFIKKISGYRNERINLARRLYDINNSVYHIIGRRENEILMFETNYDIIDINNLKVTKKTKTGVFFEDKINEYNFNYSKSTLFRKFYVPENVYSFPVKILEDPFDLLFQLMEFSKSQFKEEEFVILPLYGRGRVVFKRSGINQWNAGGRKRDINEVYIPHPIAVRSKNPNFFPPIDEQFELITPTNEVLNAKICQAGGKAIMTNPNKAISDWLLRNILHLKEGELATIEKLDELGFDSVRITKMESHKFKIDIAPTGSYEKFIGDHQYP